MSEEARGERREYARGLLVACLLIALIVLGVGPVQRAFSRTMASRNADDFTIVSSRPVQDDVEFLDLAGKTDRILYLRSDAAFAKALARALPSPPAPVKVYSGVARKMTRVAADPASIARARQMARAEIDGGSSSLLPIAAFLGVFAAWIIPSGPRLFRTALALAACASLWQILHQCPTCPVVQILGLPAGAVGFTAYASLFLLSLLAPDRREIALAATALVAAASLWQSVMILRESTACTPCSLVAFSNLYLLTSAAIGRRWEDRPAVLARIGWLAAGALGMGASLALAPAPQPVVVAGGGLKMSDVRRRVVLLGMPIQMLGLAPDPHRPVLMIVAPGCGSCEEAEAFFRAAPMPGLRIVYLNGGPKGAEVTTRRDLIQATPMFLFLDSKGAVREEKSGWSDAGDWQRRLVGDIETISAEASAEKPSRRGDK